MVQPFVPSKKCPQCGKSEYQFRGRKKIAADQATSQPEQWDTKFRCRACNHEWRVKEPVCGE
jgi:hypothetical protein